ncbi:MAG: hypothetical protein K8U57_37270 [Planctomycetes bacterium]|nr:hypothetical protein [Planctomycetota bacterium]
MTPSEKFPPAAPGIDAVVRAQLDAEASRVDAAKMRDRVLAQLEADATPRTSSGRRFALLAFAALAASLLVGVFFISPPRQAMATPAQVVESAREAYRADADRCYTQTLQLPVNSPAPLALMIDSGRTMTICTRGDRFMVEPGFGGRGTWGRDKDGRVWIAPTRDAAARFDESELPPAVRDVVKIRGLEIGTLLDEVLKDFELSWTGPPEKRAATSSVTATRRGNPHAGQIRAAELVVDKNTKLIRSLVLHREMLMGGPATITFKFVGNAKPDETLYTPEGHIDAGKPVYDATRPVLRRKILLQNLGDVIVNGL